jgi:hypothetical protein
MHIGKAFTQRIPSRRSGFLAASVIVLSLSGASSLAAPSRALAAPTLVSGASPFAPGCNGAPQTGTNYPNAEVEPFLAVDPTEPDHLVGVWQQDRWSDGGANGLATGVSWDAGQTWVRTFAHFSRCAGGNASNGGDYERASDPWVTFSPDGTAHQIGLSLKNSNIDSAILVSRSTSGGFFWSEPIALKVDTGDPNILNDKESITADPLNSRYVYAIWDRLDATRPLIQGPTWFSRTTNGGKTWERARIVYDPGLDAQTIANQIVVLPDGTLVNVFTLITDESTDSPRLSVAIIRSRNRGATWTRPTIVNTLESIGVVDVETGEPVRTGDIIPMIAVDPRSGALTIVWQDARFSGGVRDGIAYSRSTDGGRTWSPPAQVNQAPNVQAFTAAVASRDGRVAVTYYDFRNDTPDAATLLTNTWKVTSQDGGTTWQETPVSSPFDMRTAPVARGFFVGDYEGLVPRRESFDPLFVTANSGDLDNRTDVFTIAGDLEQALTMGAVPNGREELNLQPRSPRDRVRAHRESPRLAE